MLISNSSLKMKRPNRSLWLFFKASAISRFSGWPCTANSTRELWYIKILKLIETHFHELFSNKTINLKIDSDQYRVEINSNKQFAMACYAKHFILQLLSFGSQSIVQKPIVKITFKFMITNSNKYIHTKLFPVINKISNMYVH